MTKGTNICLFVVRYTNSCKVEQPSTWRNGTKEALRVSKLLHLKFSQLIHHCVHPLLVEGPRKRHTSFPSLDDDMQLVQTLIKVAPSEESTLVLFPSTPGLIFTKGIESHGEPLLVVVVEVVMT